MANRDAAKTLQLAFEFARWAITLPKPPTIEQIVEQMTVSRSTAYRWRFAWLASRKEPFLPTNRAMQLEREVVAIREQLADMQGQIDEAAQRLQLLKQRIYFSSTQE